ncbi:MAG: calcium-binding protein [Rivularia sp. (in: cyanobacteria)]
MAEQEIIAIPVNPIDEPIKQPIPVEPDFPIGGPTPEATIIVGDGIKGEAQLSADSILPAPNRIEGTDRPEILYSTPKDDLVLAKGGNDTIFGSLGDDFYNGGKGFDTLDYTLLGQKITLLPRGFIGNGSSQGSNIQEIERIVGAAGKDNTIDGSGGGKTPVFFTIDLSKNKLIVENTPTFGSVEFVVENFVNVEGTENSDFIVGDNKNNKLSGNGGNDTLIGLFGNDTLNGGSGNDTLTGADPNVQNTVKREKDILTGGTGTDTYVLGNKSGSFYDDFGNKDFAKITDFSFGEIIQLGDGETYNVEQKKGGFNIFVVEDFGRDLIGKVTLSSGISSAKSTNSSLMAASSTLDPSALTVTSSDSLTSEVTGMFTSITLNEQGNISFA